MKTEGTCTGLQVEVVDSLDKHFVSKGDLVSILKTADLYPVHKPIGTINTERIEKELLKNEMIARVEAYKTPSRLIKLEVEQKIPIIRIISSSDNYYIDNRGTVMPISPHYVADVPIASGNVEKTLAKTDLYKFALFLQKNKFWNDQIEQIYIYPDNEVDLIPRVGDHRIILGDFTDFEEKLNNLQLFYEQAIPKVGWEKYSIINLKYKDQIVCTKK
jgi:cell division protein FtsQ